MMMIDSPAFSNSTIRPKHVDFGEIEHELGFSGFEISKLESLAFSTKLHHDSQVKKGLVFSDAEITSVQQPRDGGGKMLEEITLDGTSVQQPRDKKLLLQEGERFLLAPDSAIQPSDGGRKEMPLEEALFQFSIEFPPYEDLISIVQRCREEKILDYAELLHLRVCENGLEDYRLLGNYLVALFVDCGSLHDAQKAFIRLNFRKEHSWTALIHGYTEAGEMHYAFHLYEKMKEDHIRPSKYTFLALLKACTKLKCLERGREINDDISNERLSGDLFVGNALVDMYAKCGSLGEARTVLDKMPVQDVVSWNTLITGYTEHGHGEEALSCLAEMELKRVPPDAVTYLCCLKACAGLGALSAGHKLHIEITKFGLERDLLYGNSLLDMYGKCCSLAEARKVFDELIVRDVISWTAIISGYAEHAFGEEALSCLDQMELEGVSPNAVSYVCGLRACASIRMVETGQRVHSRIVKKGLERAPFVGNTLLDMYAKCGSLSKAHLVFDELSAGNVVSWSALIAGYAEHNHHPQALSCFERMQLQGMTPNEFSWNAVIRSVSQMVKSEKGYNLYSQMLEKGLLPNIITFSCVLKAVGNSGSLITGKKIHAQIFREGLEAKEVVLATALVDMYSKCGGMIEAKETFDSMFIRDLVAWSAMILGYVRQGETELALSMYDRMREEGMVPDEMTFLSILTVCSHAGFVDRGWKYFESMSSTNVACLTIKHLNCMVDLLGRAGRLNEALIALHGMPFEPDLATCCTLLRACRMWGNKELGRHAFELAKRLDQRYEAAYVLMFNIYLDAHMWKEAKEIQQMYADLQAMEVLGKSWVEVDDLVHAFECDSGL